MVAWEFQIKKTNEFSLQAVRNSGIITGAFMNNGAIRCGGSVCRPVNAIFTKHQLPHGYVHIATIPAGASNISVLELKNSENLLGKSTNDTTHTSKLKVNMKLSLKSILLPNDDADT